MLYNEMLREKQLLEATIQFIETKIATLPAGSLICGGTKEQPRPYHHIDSAKIYISQKNIHLAENLAIKKYFTARLRDFRRKLKGINYYLKTNNPSLDTAPRLLKEDSKYSKLLAPLFKHKTEELAEWAATPYPKYSKYPQQLKYETVNGLRARSKSEAMIAMFLWEYKLPFRYEDELTLGNITIHPDFTIRHPETGAFYYYKHFGRIELEEYRKTMYWKLKLYMEHGILPPGQLIITWETKEQPLCASDILYQLEQHFPPINL